MEMARRKRKTAEIQGTLPRHRYTENPPDFALLASLYSSFRQYVFFSAEGRARIDWTDFNATRELTRVLLLHDHGINWWIPDGQLCPTVPNRSNYIHWIEDLLSSDIIRKNSSSAKSVLGFDIGTGANCIYPLLGASLFSWRFVGSDVTDVALEWAEKNVSSNPHISKLIEIRRAQRVGHGRSVVNAKGDVEIDGESKLHLVDDRSNEELMSVLGSLAVKSSNKDKIDIREPILLDVVKADEKFDFCMCNPPFFESIENAGLNPKTSCGGTIEEMVFPGGEQAFIRQIIDDSSMLRRSFTWYTSMVGRKANLKALVRRAHEVGATVVKTTEFVQGRTCRWGLAWSFVPILKNNISPHLVGKHVLTFMLEGVQRQFSAWHVLQWIESFFVSSGASATSDSATFTIEIVASKHRCDAILKKYCADGDVGDVGFKPTFMKIEDVICTNRIEDEHRFQISVFQQTPGTLLVKCLLQDRHHRVSGFLPSP